MDIKDFVKETIIGIADAIIEVNEERGETGLTACPREAFGNKYKMDILNSIITDVDFDLCVEATEDSNAEAGLKIAVAKAGIESASKNTSRNNIRFSIPVAFPSTSYKGHR